MYIGPWQEYRLAKIQDDAIQRLRREWEDQLRVELPEGDDARIRELMQPLVAKLPALLLSAKPSTRSKRREGAAGETATSDCGSARPATAALTDSHRTNTRRTERPDQPIESASASGRAKTTKPISNQDTHDATSAGNNKPPLASRAPPARKKPKKPSTAPLTALEQFQKRKKMFATWIKHASSSSDSSNNTPDPSAREEESLTDGRSVDNSAGQGIRLPPLSPCQPSPDASRSFQASFEDASGRSSHTRLPPIAHASRGASSTGWDLVYESIVTGKISSSASASESSTSPNTAIASTTASVETAECDLDDSLDEDEVNSFLNWTDTLACPNDLDDSSLLDE